MTVVPVVSENLDAQLRDKRAAGEYYDRRYAADYMEDWRPQKKQRVLDVVRSLDLAPAGDALDFGCGSGAFTQVLKQALPGWRIFGTDVSAAALTRAASRYPDCTFLPAAGPWPVRTFDFLFTHHVLEHVYDLAEVWRQIVTLLKPTSGMLHILPCGNDGSLEHRVCVLRADGIDRARENRFFFEEESHLRRLTTADMRRLAEAAGYRLAREYYATHHFGAIAWITEDVRFVLGFANPACAKDEASRRTLKTLRRQLLSYAAPRFPARLRELTRHPVRNVRFWVGALVGYPTFIATYPLWRVVERRIARLADEEWRTRRADPSGSEMFLYLHRRQAL